MAQAKKTLIRVKVDASLATAVDDWAEDEGRSRQRHVDVLLRRLNELRQSHPADLNRLGLLTLRP